MAANKSLLPRFSTLCAVMLMLLLCACSKNEFTVQVAQSPGASPVDLTLKYYASDKEKGWMMSQSIPSSLFGQKPLSCVAVRPTVVFVYSNNRLLTLFYAERGDKIVLRNQNGLWTATGNKLTDALSTWQREHANILAANATTDINRAVAAYVSEHSSSRLSALLLYAYFNANADPQRFEQLRKSLDGDADDKILLQALGILPPLPQVAGKVPDITLRAAGDTVITVSPSQAVATVYMFWYHPDKRQTMLADLGKSLRGVSSVRVIDVNMQADTMGSSAGIPADTLLRPYARLWAPGAEQNGALSPLALPAPDYLITADRAGKVLYSGTDARNAAAMALRAR